MNSSDKSCVLFVAIAFGAVCFIAACVTAVNIWGH
jgi:hypothetical protein